MTTLKIKLEDDLEASLQELAHENGMTLSEAARDALTRRLLLFRLRKRQAELADSAQRHGLQSEDDLLDNLS